MQMHGGVMLRGRWAAVVFLRTDEKNEALRIQAKMEGG